MAQDRFMIKNLLGLDENDNCPPFNPPLQPVQFPVQPAPQRLPFLPQNMNHLNIQYPASLHYGFIPVQPPSMPINVAPHVIRNRPIPVRHNPMPPRRPVSAGQIPRPPHNEEMNFDYFIAKCCHIGMPEDFIKGLASKFGVSLNMVTRSAGEYRKEHNITICLIRQAAKWRMRMYLEQQPMMSVQRIAKKCQKTEDVVIAFWVTEWFLEGEH